VKRSAPAAVAPCCYDRFNIDTAETALGERVDDLLTLPGEVRFVSPMLELAAPTAAEMAASRFPALGAGAENLLQFCPAAGDPGADLFTGQSVGRVDGPCFSLSG
jgi:hypothetical protein